MKELESIQSLFGRTMKKLTTGSWPEFLKTAAWTFKYNFPDQILIYAQKPEATACASIETWNERLHRTVRPDAAHIALLDDSGDHLKLHYVIDVSDTEGDRSAPVWVVNEQKEPDVRNALTSAFLPEIKEIIGDPQTDFYLSVAESIVSSHIDYASYSLQLMQDDKLNSLSASESESILKELLVASTAAVIMYRCGFEPDFSSKPEIFDKISIFENPRALSILGQTTQAMSREALMVVAESVRKWDKTHKEDINHGNELSESRGVSDSRTNDPRSTSLEQVRSDAENLSEREPSERVHSTDPDRGTADPSSSNRHTDRTAGERTGSRASEDQPGTGSANEQRSQNTAHDASASAGRGTDSSSNSVRITEGQYPNASEYGIHVEFPSHEEQKVVVKERTSGLSLPQEEINYILTNDLNGKIDLQSLEAFFQTMPSNAEGISTLRKTYAGIYHELLLPSGLTAELHGKPSGFMVRCDNQELTLSWSYMSKRIRNLISENQYIYLPNPDEREKLSVASLKPGQSIIFRGKEYEIDQIDDDYVSLHNKLYTIISDTMTRTIFETILSQSYHLVQEEEYIQAPEITEPEPSEQFPEASEADTHVTSAPEPQSQATTLFPVSIDQEEIDHILRVGSNTGQSRIMVATEFMKGKTVAEIADYLKNIYVGGYGIKTDNGQLSAWYSDEGIRFAQGTSARYEPSADILSWQGAAIRIGQLLAEGQFATSTELLTAPGYERNELAKDLWYLYRDFSDTAKEHGYLSCLKDIRGGGFPKETAKIADMLVNPEFQTTIISEFKEFAEAYQEDRTLLRFRHHRPAVLLVRLQDLQVPRMEFVSQLSVIPQVHSFITSDEINHQISRGSSFSEGKNRIYEYFRQSHTISEKAKFLSREYGTGGYSPIRGVGEDHDAKGLHYTKRNCSDITIPWPNVAKRIDSLISENRYMTPEQQEAYPAWLEKVTAERKEAEEAKRLREARNAERLDTSSAVVDSAEPGDIESAPTTGLPDRYIDDILVEDKMTSQHTWNDTIMYFGTHPEPADRITFLKERYGDAYTYLSASDGTKLGFKVFDDHLEVWQDNYMSTDIRQQIPWSEIIQRIEQKAALELSEGIEPEAPEVSDPGYEFSLFDFTYDTDENIQSEELAADLSEPEPAEEDPTPSEPEHEPEQSDIVSTPFERSNYTITDMAPDYGGPKVRFRNNIIAIRLLKQIESENRLATPDEQEVLAKYVGWGGLSQAFDVNNAQWSEEYLELKELLSSEEYSNARESTLTAFYTPPAVTEAIFTTLRNLGFQRGNILDPCCGTGNFFGMLPEDMESSKLYGIELDSISGRISQQLYQKASIRVEGYEKANLPDSFFDAVIGNVPFGSFKLHDRRYDKENFLIHDYFFAKSLDKVRPGGVVAFITTKGTMDKENESIRRYIAQRADLLGAIRLPNNTFKGNAGTEAVADILFLQKRSRAMVHDPYWTSLDYANVKDSSLPHQINAYFVDNPEMVLGELKEVSGPYGPELTCVAREGEDIREALQEAIKNITGEIEFSFDELEEGTRRDFIPADPNVRNFSYTIVDGDIYFREDSNMRRVELKPTAEKRVKGLIEIRDLTRALIDAQVENASDAAVSAIQDQLNEVYDAYTAKYGIINSRGNSNAFSDDSSYYLLCSLEHLDDEGNFIGKADMFTKRTIGAHNVVTHADTAQEALSVSMGELGRVDLDYMSQLSDLTKSELLADLTGIVFAVPGKENEYELSSTYLSGNVREKLKTAIAFAESNPQYQVNVEYLQNALPETLTPEDISVRLGSTWIPDTDVTEFMYELLSTSGWYRDKVKAIYEPVTDTWTIKNKNWDSYNALANSTYGTKRAHAYRLLEDALNQKNTQIFDSVQDHDGNTRRVLNANDTIEAREKQEQIKEKFKEWVWSDPDRSERLCALYNERFNSVVPPEYDGNMVTFHNMNPLIKLEKHQKEAVARILYGGNTQLAHVVGAGKTWTMVAAAMESKRLGLCNKSMIVVPNHLVGQWASAIYDLYPSANVLASTKKDFETKNRKKFCSRIATGDYDIVVIGHSQFEKIPLSYERQVKNLQDQIDDIVESISVMKSGDAEHFTIKQMEATKKRLTTRLEKLQDSKKRDDVVTFEELGVDRLFVDESHEYKNLFLYTKMHNVAGIAQTDSQKASDLFGKCRYIDEITGNMGNIHATGTPLSNTMAELYTTQRYLQYDLLQSMGLGSFDAWASTFGETVQSLELAPEGTGYRERTRFANFFNIPELVNLYKQVADIRTADMLNLPVPEVEYHTVVVQASEEQKAGVQQLGERAEKIRNRQVKSNEDNMLCITNDGRKLALDQRLIDPDLPDNPNSKANACADYIWRYYVEGNDKKLTQLVFCDLSTPKNKTEFNVYDDLKEKLIERGIPAEEIRFIHEANSDAQKEALFSQVRSGAVRVLMGSTGKMGTGTNVQDLLIAGHDLDCPWRPSDLEQRAGRVIRRGNSNEKVHMHRYVTEGTFDAYMYQLIEAKQRFTSQIMTSKSPVRVAADIDESVLNYSQIKALASGNPKVREKIELEIEVARLTMLEGRHKREQYRLNNLIHQKLPAEIKELSDRIIGLEADNELLSKHASRTSEGKMVPATINGQTYEKQSEAGEAIIDLAKKLPEHEKWYNIGSLRGFKIIAYSPDPNYSSTPKIALANNRRYQIELSSNPVGLMTRLNNVLDDTIPDKYKSCKKDLARLQIQLESAKKEYGKPFPNAEALREKSARLKELEAELNLDIVQSQASEHVQDSEIVESTESISTPTASTRSLNDMIARASERQAQQQSGQMKPTITSDLTH